MSIISKICNVASKIITVTVGIFILLLLVPFLFMFQESGYVHCVVVDKQTNFSGEQLMYSVAKIDRVIPLEKCEDFDKQLDHGDGSSKGVVRWVKCLSGPDCDENGVY